MEVVHCQLLPPAPLPDCRKYLELTMECINSKRRRIEQNTMCEAYFPLESARQRVCTSIPYQSEREMLRAGLLPPPPTPPPELVQVSGTHTVKTPLLQPHSAALHMVGLKEVPADMSQYPTASAAILSLGLSIAAVCESCSGCARASTMASAAVQDID